MKNILLIFVEGDHDEAFLYKILRYEGFSDISNKKINEFEPFLQNYWLGQLKNYKYEEGNLRGKPALPTPLVFYSPLNEKTNKNNPTKTIVLLYPLGGDSRADVAKKIIQDFLDLKAGADLNNAENINIKLFFNRDADNKGIDKVIQKIKDDFKDVLGKEINDLEHLGMVSHDIFQCVACYIFAGEDGKGKLENIIVPLMETSNEEIFEKARNFLKIDPKIKKGDLDFDQLKAEIGVVGQLQKSGKANATIIKDTKYITKEKVQANAKCQEIIKFIKDVINFTPTTTNIIK